MNRPFTDRAGYTRHCWECRHAQDWHKVNTLDEYEGYCWYRAGVVGRYDSPNNGSTKAGGCVEYTTKE